MKKMLFVCLILFFGCSKKNNPEPPKILVSAELPTFKDTPIFLQVTGHVEAYQHVEVRPQVTGLVTGIYYKEGQVVKEGDLLVTIDDRPFIADLEKNEALLEENRAKLLFDEETYARNVALVKEDYISQNAFDNLTKNVEVSRAMVEQNLADIELAKIDLDYCFIKAPISGVVGNKLIDIGNLVTKDTSESLLVTINQISPIYTSFYIPEKDLHHVIMARAQSQNPLQVIVSFDEAFDETYEGYLEFINNQVDEKTGMILLKGVFTNNEQILWPGQYVNVRLITHIAKHAMLIPVKAVQINAKGPYVYVVNESNIVEIKQLKLGQLHNEECIVLSGINENDRIITNGTLNVYPGAKVSVQSGVKK